MKRQKLIKYLTENNCFLEREGSRHSIYTNRANGQFSSVPRHPDINDYTINDICKQLGIPKMQSH
jgi:predicted RNA binding protein YcfA (HicA-like mRNA interferase family)